MSTTADSIAREIGDLVVRIERLEALFLNPSFSIPKSIDGRLHLDRIVKVMRSKPGQWLSVRELALGASLSLGAARFIVYKYRDTFELQKRSPRRCYWRLRPQEVPAHA